MRLLLPVLLPACVSTGISATGMHQLEFVCSDLQEEGGQGGAYVEVVLVEDADAFGWVAILGSGGEWEEAEGVRVSEGSLVLEGGCQEGRTLRLSWW